MDFPTKKEQITQSQVEREVLLNHLALQGNVED